MISPVAPRRPMRPLVVVAVVVAAAACAGRAPGDDGPLSPVRQADGGRSPAARGVVLVGDTVGDPGFVPGSAADSPTESSGAFDAVRGDLGAEDDLSGPGRGPGRSRSRPPAAPLPDPLADTPRIDPATTGVDAERIVATLLPPRTDAPRDWVAPLEPLHACGEPRALPPCVPPAPCHPARPPQPFDLVGVRGTPSCGPIYRGPCEPRSGTRHEGPWRWLASAHDRLVDLFYTSR